MITFGFKIRARLPESDMDIFAADITIPFTPKAALARYIIREACKVIKGEELKRLLWEYQTNTITGWVAINDPDLA